MVVGVEPLYAEPEFVSLEVVTLLAPLVVRCGFGSSGT